MVYKIIINSTFEDVDLAVDKIVGFITNQCLLPRCSLLFMIEFALRELLTNAVEHGNELIHDKKASCLIDVSEDKVYLEITDQGRGFIIKEYIPENPNNLLSQRGRGLYILVNMGFSLNVNHNCVSAFLKFPK